MINAKQTMGGLVERPLFPKLQSMPPVEKDKQSLVLQGTNFLFVNLHNDQRLRPSPESQTVIRSQAMRSFLRNERPVMKNAYEANSSSPKPRTKTGKSKGKEIMFRLLPKNMQELPKRARKKRRGLDSQDQHIRNSHNADLLLEVSPVFESIQSVRVPELGSGNLDPFDSLPFPINQRTQYILRYSDMQITASTLMLNLKKKWFTLALKDEAYFHAALSHYSGHLFLTRDGGRGDPVEAVFHRAESVRILNERFQRWQELSDGTIGAVACMVNYEASNGSLKSVRTHMSGLEQMVKLRGDLRDGGFPMYLHRLVAWADVNSAFALSTTPVLAPILRVDESTLEKASSSHGKYMQSTTIGIVMNDLRYLASISPNKNIHSGEGSTPQSLLALHAENVSYSDTLYHCKRTLLFLSLSNNHVGVQNFVDRALADAALLITEIWGRGTGVNAIIVDTGLARLESSLRRIDINAMVGSEHLDDDEYLFRNRAVFWSSLVGLVISNGRAHQQIFIHQIKRLSEYLKIQTWEDAKETLGAFVWCGIWETRGRDTWEKIVDLL